MFQNCKIVGPCLDPEKYFGVNDKIPRTDPKFVMTSSQLRAFIHCASRWRAGYEPPESDAKKTGSLLDCKLLTPKLFNDRYAIQPDEYPVTDKSGEETGEMKPWSNLAKWCKEWRQEVKDAGMVPVSKEDVAEADMAVKRVMADEILSAWFAACDTQIWIKGEWVDKATKLVIPVQALLDFVPRRDTEFAKCLGDLKCIRSASLRPFTSQVFQYGWHLQAAFYSDLYMAATNPKNDPDGEDRNTWCFCGVENYPPFEPFRRLLMSDYIAIGRQTYDHALGRYAKALKSGVWLNYDDGNPDGIQGWSPVAPAPWMEFEAMSEKLEGDAADAMQENDPVHENELTP